MVSLGHVPRVLRVAPKPRAGVPVVSSFSHSVSSLQQAAHTQEALEEAVQMMKEAVEDLTTTLNEAASAAGVVGGMVDSITQAINQVRGTQRGLGERRRQRQGEMQKMFRSSHIKVLGFRVVRAHSGP